MQGKTGVLAKVAGKVSAIALAAVVAASLSVGPAASQQAYAASGDLTASGIVLSTQASVKLATSSKSAISKTAVKNAKAIIKAAKATKGTNAEKLEKVFAYIATPKGKYGGKLISSESYFAFWTAAKANASKAYYPAQPTKLEGLFKKFAIDSYKSKKASCYHYASLFAVTAKQLLGKSATVKVAIGPANYYGTDIKYHAWSEVKIGKTTYIYDTSAGNYYITNVSKKAGDFGPYCGTKKTDSKMKSVYKKFKTKNIGYATVTL